MSIWMFRHVDAGQGILIKNFREVIKMQKKSLLKKSLAVLMAAAMTAGLAGCGGSGDSYRAGKSG